MQKLSTAISTSAIVKIIA